MSWVVPILATVFSSPVGLVPRELMNPATPIVCERLPFDPFELCLPHRWVSATHLRDRVPFLLPPQKPATKFFPEARRRFRSRLLACPVVGE
jgi:hypothetical protein